MTDRILVQSLGDLKFWTRPHLCDETVIEEVIDHDGYGTADMDLQDATVLDLGAHIGVFSMLCAHLGARTVYAVEPQPENLELLHQNVGHIDQITVIETAVGATSGTAWLAGESGGTHTEPGHPDAIEVPQTTLADLLTRVGPVDVLKLDMEGGEVDALLATSHDLLAMAQRIVMETHGPISCPWMGKPRVGEVLEHLLYTHNIKAAGYPTRFGKVSAVRNGVYGGW